MCEFICNQAKPIQLEDKFLCKSVPERLPTEVQEFQMPGRFFHEHARESLQKKVQEQIDQAHLAATFVARPAPSFDAANGNKPTGVAVAPSTKALTAATSPGLATKTRAEQRREFDERVRRNQEAEAAARVEAEVAALAAEEEEIKALRKSLVFEAKPILHELINAETGKPRGVAAVAPRPLTTPVTPYFATEQRAMMRTSRKQMSAEHDEEDKNE